MAKRTSYAVARGYGNTLHGTNKGFVASNALAILLCVITFILTSLFVFTVYYAG